MSALPEPGNVLDGFTIIRELGRGGMGAVFLARKGATSYAIKLLLDLEPEQLLRFEREAQALAAVDRHPNIVTIHTLGRFRGKPYVVMDYVEGGDLRSLLKARGRLELDEALSLLAAVADAVGSIHARGFIHRDLKPENILIRAEDGAPVVTDFGLARGDGFAALTRTGALAGTPHYMAPEQLEPTHALTPAADVWALGVVLYELLSGRRPFEGEGPAAIGRAILRSTPKRLELPKPVAAVLAGCLARAPGSRLSSAAALRDGLEGALGALAPWPRWLRRTITALAAAALLAAALPFLPYKSLQEGGPRSTADCRRLLAILDGFDAAFVDFSEGLLQRELRRVLAEAPVFVHSPDPGACERLRAIYDRLEEARDERVSSKGLTAEELQRVKLAYALFKETSAPLARAEAEPFGRVIRAVRRLHREPGSGVPRELGELGNSSISGEARLLRMVALLSELRSGRWSPAFDEARRLRLEHGQGGLEAAVLETVTRSEARPPRSAEFWFRIYARALEAEATSAAQRAFVILAELDPAATGARLRAALEATTDEARPALIQGFIEAIREARLGSQGAASAAFEESMLSIPEALGAGLTRAQAVACIEFSGSYVRREELTEEERSAAFARCLEISRLFPELPVPYPLPEINRLVDTEKRSFLSFRHAAYDVARMREAEFFIRRSLFFDLLRAACRKGIYVETRSEYLYRLKRTRNLNLAECELAVCLLLIQIDLHLVHARLVEDGGGRGLYDELEAGLARVFKEQSELEERRLFLSLARYYRGRLLQYGAFRGWVDPEAALPRILEDLRAAMVEPENPRGGDALIYLWRRHPESLGEDSLADFRELTDRLLLRRRATKGLTPRSRGPWASPIPTFSHEREGLGLFFGHTGLALRLGRRAAAWRYLEDYGERIERPALVSYCRGLIRCDEGAYQKALDEIEGLSVEDDKFLIEIKAQALAKLGRRAEALEVIDKHHDASVKQQYRTYVDERWKP